jgi:hypothetical protein
MRKCILILLASIATVAGATPSLSDQVRVDIAPAKPVVFNAPFSYDMNGKTVVVEAPWLRSQLRLTNGSSQPVTVVSVNK